MADKNEDTGFIHLYTGNGKGKTTAAIGLAVRAAGAGKSVFIAQFVKGMHYAELDSLKRFPEIVVKQYGLDCFIVNSPTQRDIDAARAGLEEVTAAIADNHFDMVILDEVCIALYYKLFSVDEVISLLRKKTAEMEIILTGRYAPEELIATADLVTEMREIKHYYSRGVEARKGIEY
ncbi:MAG: cob(I)yrinic acid a,c-diamide adenosyltransferase [Tenuifilaceae bacterium]|jgi:cob(I)alamin adenosyltransferase|nr:cob(I)yrinic acid a,c-diamide adenosyltransferase [Bacteroidales bacterium]MDI9515374.1 cob(I)yrinic acid a,c-diamide adenosyltransferase [Bacteroidota bacterium]NLH56218.1 cob(I)yrinic acid a,c-diamide adenosyltransferase [Rikenellaceae bacterium]OQC62479.1 MAG: Cob(I)yrinic acid a,c-diamide adenosyltransferase [Bacteroidetes bacterium ADurb.Bin008]HNV81924.1 cob(I)yrinic acid a,c-diamide adenosyltransferase [Tenuifilaceae bacterium]